MDSPRFRSVVLDVDSTLCGVEGIDWLAGRRGPDVDAQIRALTDLAMNGEISLDAVYGQRLSVIAPTREDIAALSRVYEETIATGAREVIAAIRGAGVRVVLVSGGLRPAIMPLANSLGVELHAVDIHFDEQGRYAGFDERSPLATQTGKRTLLEGLGLERPILAVGDGATDLAMREAVDLFVAYTGFVRRDAVVAEAVGVVDSFSGIAQLVAS